MPEGGSFRQAMPRSIRPKYANISKTDGNFTHLSQTAPPTLLDGSNLGKPLMSDISQNALLDKDSEAAARFRRLRWRTRRGLLENDILFSRLLDSRAETGFLESEIAALDRLLDLTDPVLLDLVLGRTQPEGELDTPEVVALLAEIRSL